MLIEVEQREVGEFYLVCGTCELAGPFETSEIAESKRQELIADFLKD